MTTECGIHLRMPKLLSKKNVSLKRKMFNFGEKFFLYFISRARLADSIPEGVFVETLFVDVKLYMEIGSL